MPERTTLPQQATAHALRHFIVTPSLWAIYGANAIPAGAVFSGYALSIGVTEAQIAFLVGLTGLFGVWQIVSFYIGRVVPDKARFATRFGPVEITFASAVILAALLPAQYRYIAIALCLSLACFIGHTISPMYNSWMANVIPGEFRGGFIGKQMAVLTIVSAVHLYLAGLWIDYMKESYEGFLTVFIFGWLAGVAGYLVLGRTPYPRITEDEPAPQEGSIIGSLSVPLKDRGFTRLCIYLMSRMIPMQMAGAFYGVYMINHLEISYSAIAIYNNMTLICMFLGYIAFGQLSQRYGSRPILQILSVPITVVPIMWAFVTTSNMHWLLPSAFILNGLALSGVFVATSNLLFKIIPSGEENSAYFGVWMAVASIGAGVGPFAGGFLRNWLPAETILFGYPMTALQTIFALSTGIYVLGIISSLFLIEDEAASPRYLLSQFRGNLLSLSYNMAIYSVARQDETRAGAIRAIGRSGSPLGLGSLLHALDNISPLVRQEAVKGIGEGRFPEAVDPLVRELEDNDSDIRPEAAEALGKIGHDASLEPLLQAIEDPDARVRTSAIQALGHLRTPYATEVLLNALNGPFDRNTFPVIVDAAARSGDLRLVEPAMQGLRHLNNPVLRLQVINAIGRVLGEKNHFYRIATANTLQRASLREAMMKRVRKLIRESDLRNWQFFSQMLGAIDAALADLDEDRNTELAQHCRDIAALTLHYDNLNPIAERAAYAVITYVQDTEDKLMPDEGIVFLIVCLTSLARHLPKKGRVKP